MPDRDRMEMTPRRDLHVFYVLDTSGSMEGKPIQILNQEMLETVRVLNKVAKRNGDAQLKLSVLEFSSTAKWMQKNGPENVEDFIWSDLSAGGLTNIGAALRELNSKLSTKEFLRSSSGTLLPIIIFMTDGYATDEYEKQLAVIKKNKLFRRAAKIGFAIGDNPDVEMIAHLTGDSEAVVQTDDLQMFAKLLQFVSVTSSIMQSTSQVTGGQVGSGREALKRAREEAGIEEKDIRPGFTYLDEETVALDGIDPSASSLEVAWEDNEDDW